MEEQDRASTTRLGSFLSALRADRFQVTRGAMYKPDILQLACDGIAPSCNGNNNTNPYLLALVPPAGTVLDPTNPSLNFTIRQDEAVVLIGRTPPPVAYFSFRTFALNRFFAREGIRRKVFASLGDPHNMLTLETAGQAKGDPYDKAFVLLVAADKGTQTRVRRALKLAGYPDAIVNEDVISPNLAKMSSTVNGDSDSLKDDDFVLLQRFALWEYGYEEAGQAYLDDPPVTVLRLTPSPRTEKKDYRPLPVERIRPRGTGLTELDLLPEVDALGDAIVAKYPGMRAEDVRPATWLEESFVAIQEDRDVLGESRDTVYLRNEGTFTLADDEFVVVYGVNHEKTGKATYSSFSVYDECRACPYEGENSRRVAGSALDYFSPPSKPPAHVDSLYAWTLARNCGTDARCTEIPEGSCGTEPPGIAPDGRMFVGFRAYVEPATRIGPAFTEVVYDRVLRFTPAAPEISGVTVNGIGQTRAPTTLPAGTTVEIRFRVSGISGTKVTWTAAVKADDGCGELQPSSTTVDDVGATGSVDATTTLKVGEGQKTLLTLFLNAIDGKGRRARTVGLQLRFQ